MVESDIHYPTDTSLLADGVRVITRTVVKLKRIVAEVGSRFVNHTRKVKKTCLGLSKVLKGRISKDNSKLVNAKEELIQVAEEVIVSGRHVKTQVAAAGGQLPQAKRIGGN